MIWSYHFKSNYLEWWNNISFKLNLNILNKKNVKLRIFNNFYYDLYLKSNITTCYINYENKGTKINEISLNYKYSYSYIIHNNHKYFINIVGYYYTNNHLVLCGPPDAKTLIKAYKKYPLITMQKLNAISNGNASQLINYAQSLVNDVS